MIKKLIKSIFEKVGIKIERIHSRVPTDKKLIPIPLWDEDNYFNQLFHQIEQYTLAPKKDSFMLYQLAKYAKSLFGEIVEVGVYKGGTARLLAKVFSDNAKVKNVHLFDTFSGMPRTDARKDWHKEGDFADTSLDQVRKFLSDCNNVILYKGFFPQTANSIEDKNFCFVHIDVDIYKSVMDCCQFFYPRLVRGGIMIFDDYGRLTCPGAKTAVDEFFMNMPEQPCYLLTGQSFIIKK